MNYWWLIFIPIVYFVILWMVALVAEDSGNSSYVAFQYGIYWPFYFVRGLWRLLANGWSRFKES